MCVSGLSLDSVAPKSFLHATSSSATAHAVMLASVFLTAICMHVYA